ncbi:MAG: hypothetical protein FJ125_03960, partial [Deltaproteobacteria bacterium]|nr:hypothetical protein [Deltaproteobacteria bacterium]
MQAKEPGRSSGGSELPARRAGHGTPPTRAAQPDRPAPAAVGSTRSVRRRLLQPGPRRALLLLLLAGAAVLRWYDLHPIVWKPAELLTSGEALLHPVPADLLLVVDPAAVRRAAARGRSFAQADWSYGWYNFAVQELGWVAVLALQTLGPLDLAGRRAVVVTRSAVASALPHLAELAAFVEKGGLLLLEQPDDGWQQLTGVRGLGALQPAGPLSGTLIEQGYPELLRMPTPTQLLPLDCAARGAGERAGQAAPAPAPGGAEVLLRSDGQPAACLRRVGHGAVVTLGLDVGRLITALQQGMPDPGGFRVSNRYPDRLSRHLESSDLVADPRLLDNPVPFADLLETLLASLLDRGNGPLPRWWGFPAGMAGAYLVTHDEEGVGDKAAWMAEAESRWGVRSTYFLMPGPGPSPAGLSTIRSAAALGLHWNKLDDPDEEGLEKLGWGPIRPLARMSTLVEQAGWLAGLTGQPPRLNRNHFLLWDAG